MALPKLSPERRRVIAAALKVDEQYVYQVCARLKTASPALARGMNQVEPAMRLWDLRPDDWHRIWPELVGAEGAPGVTEQPGQGASQLAQEAG
jgi:hypothetical protein